MLERHMSFKHIVDCMPYPRNALFHRQTVAHTQQNLINYKINKNRKRKIDDDDGQPMHTKIC